MYPETGFILLTLAIAGFLFYRAYTNGVVSMLWSIAGILAGLAGGYVFYGFLPDLFPNWESFRGKLLLAFFVGLFVYLVVRWIVKALLQRLFTIGPMKYLADGISGGLLSLIPTLVTAFILLFCIRIGGTAVDLKRYERLSIPDINYLTRQYPERPWLASWRDGVENLPLVLPVVGALDRYSKVPERTLVALLITSKKEALFNHLKSLPKTGSLIASDAFADLISDTEIQELNQKRHHFALLVHPEIRKAALDRKIRGKLEELALDEIIDTFMLSPERQEMLESLERRDVPVE